MRKQINKSQLYDKIIKEKHSDIYEYINKTERQYLWQSKHKKFDNHFYKRQLNGLSTDVSCRNRTYEFTNKDAKELSQLGYQQGQHRFNAEQCRIQIYKHLRSLNMDYKYNFYFQESPSVIEDRKRMTRTIYLSFSCNKCNQNRWTSISGTFQITFQYSRVKKYFLFDYHVRIFRAQCCTCRQYKEPLVNQTQIKAMKIFFSVIIINIVEQKKPPEKPKKYYIKPNHWHKSQWCEACQLGRCTTQNHID